MKLFVFKELPSMSKMHYIAHSFEVDAGSADDLQCVLQNEDEVTVSATFHRKNISGGIDAVSWQ